MTAKDNAALVWQAVQGAVVRWRAIREDNPGLAPFVRDALDVADAAQELVARGDAKALATLAKASRSAVRAASKSRTLDRVRQERERLRRDVNGLRTGDGHQVDRASAVVQRLSCWPALTASVFGTVTMDAWAKRSADATKVVDRCLDVGHDTRAIIERGLVALGLPRDAARTVAGARTVAVKRAKRAGKKPA